MTLVGKATLNSKSRFTAGKSITTAEAAPRHLQNKSWRWIILSEIWENLVQILWTTLLRTWHSHSPSSILRSTLLMVRLQSPFTMATLYLPGKRPTGWEIEMPWTGWKIRITEYPSHKKSCWNKHWGGAKIDEFGSRCEMVSLRYIS